MCPRGAVGAAFFSSTAIRDASASEGEKGGEKKITNAHHLRNEFIEVVVFFPISKCLVQRFK